MAEANLPITATKNSMENDHLTAMQLRAADGEAALVLSEMTPGVALDATPGTLAEEAAALAADPVRTILLLLREGDALQYRPIVRPVPCFTCAPPSRIRPVSV